MLDTVLAFMLTSLERLISGRVFILILAALLPVSVNGRPDGRPTGYKSLKELIADSSVICAGEPGEWRVEKARQSSHNGPAGWLVTDVTVDHVIKGSVSGKQIHIRLEGLTPFLVSKNFITQPPSKRCVFFMVPVFDHNNTYALVDNATPVYDSRSSVLPLAADRPPEIHAKMTTDDRIEAELLAAARTLNTKIALPALDNLWEWDRRTKAVKQALVSLSDTRSNAVADTAVAIRLERGDMTALDCAHFIAESEGFPGGRFGESLRLVTDPKYVNDLIRFAASKNFTIVDGAIQALQSMADVKMKALLEPVFQRALDNESRDIQFQALRGLAVLHYGKAVEKSSGSPWELPEITPAKPVPSYFEFVKDPQRYIIRWKQPPTKVPDEK